MRDGEVYYRDSSIRTPQIFVLLRNLLNKKYRRKELRKFDTS